MGPLPGSLYRVLGYGASHFHILPFNFLLSYTLFLSSFHVHTLIHSLSQPPLQDRKEKKIKEKLVKDIGPLVATLLKNNWQRDY